jgi:hypothetical protein
MPIKIISLDQADGFFRLYVFLHPDIRLALASMSLNQHLSSIPGGYM